MSTVGITDDELMVLVRQDNVVRIAEIAEKSDDFNPNTRCIYSRNTLLHQAVRNKNLHMICLLMALGVDPEAQNSRGEDMWKWVSYFGISDRLSEFQRMRIREGFDLTYSSPGWLYVQSDLVELVIDFTVQ